MYTSANNSPLGSFYPLQILCVGSSGGVTRPDGITDRMNASLGHGLAALASKPAIPPTCQPLFEGMRVSVTVSPLAILEQAHRRVRSAEQSCSGVVAGVPAHGIQEGRTGVDREMEFSQHAHDLAAVSEQLGGEHSVRSVNGSTRNGWQPGILQASWFPAASTSTPGRENLRKLISLVITCAPDIVGTLT